VLHIAANTHQDQSDIVPFCDRMMCGPIAPFRRIILTIVSDIATPSGSDQ